MRPTTKKLFLAALVGSLLLTSTAFAKKAEEAVTIRFANIKLIVNGQTIPTKAEPFIYNGNVYAPVATVANMLGIRQEWDNATPAVRFADNDWYNENENTGNMGERAVGFTPLTSKRDIGLMIASGTDYVSNRYYDFVDNGKQKHIPIPRIEKEGYANYQTLVTSKFVNITGQSESEFILHESVTKQGETQDWISLFRYESGTVKKLGSVMIHEDNGDTIREVEFNPVLKKLTLFIYDSTRVKVDATNDRIDKTLSGVEMYEYKDGKLMNTQKLVK